MSTVIYSPADLEQRQVFRESLSALRQQIKIDALAIRAAKQALRLSQSSRSPEAPYQQSSLSRLRKLNRARQLVSGLLRGRTWARMEANHPDGDIRLAYQLRLVWSQVSRDGALAAPDQLKAYLS